MIRIAPIVVIREDQGFTYRARVVDEDGSVIVVGDLQSWDVRVYETISGAETVVQADLGKSIDGVIQPLGEWSRDSIGFNFRYDFPYNYWDMVGGKTYRLELTLYKQDGEPIREVQKVRVRNFNGV